MVEIAPSFLPDLRARLLPPQVSPGEQQLESFSKAGLSRTVAANNQDQPGSRWQRKRDTLSDTTESLHRDGRDVHSWRLRQHTRRRCGLRQRRCRWHFRGVIQVAVERRAALKSGQDPECPGLIGSPRFDEPVYHAALEFGRHDSPCQERECECHTRARRVNGSLSCDHAAYLTWLVRNCRSPSSSSRSRTPTLSDAPDGTTLRATRTRGSIVGPRTTMSPGRARRCGVATACGLAMMSTSRSARRRCLETHEPPSTPLRPV